MRGIQKEPLIATVPTPAAIRARFGAERTTIAPIPPTATPDRTAIVETSPEVRPLRSASTPTCEQPALQSVSRSLFSAMARAPNATPMPIATTPEPVIAQPTVRCVLDEDPASRPFGERTTREAGTASRSGKFIVTVVSVSGTRSTDFERGARPSARSSIVV